MARRGRKPKPVATPPHIGDVPRLVDDDDELNARYVAEAWRLGHLKWLARPSQLPAYDFLRARYEDPQVLKVYFDCARRFGKSSVALLIMIEECLRQPGFICRFISTTAKDLRTITRPAIAELLRTCPDNLKPRFDRVDNQYIFPNGSLLSLHGTDSDRADTLRGMTSMLTCVDEAGFLDNLETIVKNGCLPPLLERDGTLLLVTTPADTPDHYSEDLYQECLLKGNVFTRTIWQSDYPKDKITLFAEEVGGFESITFRREFECRHIVNTDRVVWPEFSAKEAAIVAPHRAQRPSDYAKLHRIVAMDFGFGGDGSDRSAAILGYWDFKHARLVIETEKVWSDGATTTAEMAEDIRAIEAELGWDKLPDRNVRRVGDCSHPQIMLDFTRLHGMTFVPVRKKTLDAMVADMRLAIQDERILIDESCQQTIGCLRSGRWDKARKRWQRTDAYGHLDAGAAALYGWLHASTTLAHLNPYPDPVFDPARQMPRLGRPPQSKNASVWKRALGLG